LLNNNKLNLEKKIETYIISAGSDLNVKNTTWNWYHSW